jgi:branched-chain amino acid transport system permease protein
MRIKGRLDAGLASVFLAVAVNLPLIINSRYILGEVILLFFYMVIAAQWNLLYGVAGVFSLAQTALFAFGAYVTAMLGYYFGLNLWLGMLAGAVAAVVLSVVMGIACLRLSGPYVALLTLAVAQALYVLIITDTDCFRMEGTTCRQFTGGAVGFSGYGDLGTRAWFGNSWQALVADYYIVLVVLIITLVFTYLVFQSSLWLAFRALRDNPSLAVCRGINRFKFQLLVFALSSFFTGLAGGVYAGHFRSVSPSVFSLSLLLLVMSMVVVGGVGSFWGPVAGSLMLMGADEMMRELGQFREVGLGLILVGFVLLLPRGLCGALEGLAERLGWLGVASSASFARGSTQVCAAKRKFGFRRSADNYWTRT